MISSSHKALVRQSRLTFYTSVRGYASKPSCLNEHFIRELLDRRLPLVVDDLVPGSSHRLNVSLSSFLPNNWLPTSADGPLPLASSNLSVPLAHHLIYFNPAIPAGRLLPDGTDPLQSPGEPWVRRMWAGGYLKVNPDPSKTIVLDGKRWVCLESIRDVSVKGEEGNEKIFVGIERRIGRLSNSETATTAEDYVRIRDRLGSPNEDEFQDASLIERRNIVFMRERSKEEVQAMNEAAKAKAPRPLKEPSASMSNPDITHTLHPTSSLLFRYSALTFNAHAIHLDPHYCRTVEGHRDLLFHGPLSFTLLTIMMQHHVNETMPGHEIAQIDYRNIAPLYANEPLKLCARKMSGDGEGEAKNQKFMIWAETPEGRVAVKGTARVAKTGHK